MAKTVLIIEDNELNLRLFADIVRSRGHRALCASEALEGFETAQRERPDLVLMDIQLPAVSGLEVTRWIKADPDLAATPVVAVTAFAMAGDEARILEAGCAAHVAKPISVTPFLALIDRLLEEPSPT